MKLTEGGGQMQRAKQYSGGQIEKAKTTAKYIGKKAVKYDFSEYEKLTKPDRRDVDLLLSKLPPSLLESGKKAAVSQYCDNHSLPTEHLSLVLRMHGY